MITAKQIKAARALIDWSQQDLADQCDMSKTAIANIESGQSRPTDKNMTNILNAFDRAGVEFITDGVREKKDLIEVLSGYEGVAIFFKKVLSEAIQNGGTFLVYGVDEQKFTDAGKKAGIDEFYRERMAGIKNIHFNVLISDEDENTYSAQHCTYKKLPGNIISDNAPFYIFGNNLALIVWKERPKIIVIQDEDLTEAYRRQFMFLWNNASV